MFRWTVMTVAVDPVKNRWFFSVFHVFSEFFDWFSATFLIGFAIAGEVKHDIGYRNHKKVPMKFFFIHTNIFCCRVRLSRPHPEPTFNINNMISFKYNIIHLNIIWPYPFFLSVSLSGSTSDCINEKVSLNKKLVYKIVF